VSLARLWAGWRSSYIESVATAEPADDECLFCALPTTAADEAQLVAREPLVYAALNLYPYTSGHLLVAPTRHVGDLEALDADEGAALMTMTQHATAALKAAYRPDGVNVGVNLHVHVLPRWVGDTNFLTSVAEARVLPEALAVSRDKLRAAWPT
jgi:diadenosine tetraphosphate (Ap4A) HIT family hydrolase